MILSLNSFLKCDGKKITVAPVRSTGIGFRGTRTEIRATKVSTEIKKK